MFNQHIVKDYLTLCKPRVVLLMLVTAWVGMYLANPQNLNWLLITYSSIGIACAAGSAAIINHLMDRHIDRKMTRTAARPIAAGRISPAQAIMFASSLAIAAWLILSNLVNMLSTILTFATFIGYALIYTMYLKRATHQNIVLGGLAGAMPPLLGWSAISGTIHPHALLLVAIIFTWTPPHFWALAIYRNNDYAAAKIPMLPVTHGIAITKLCVFLYACLLLAVTCLPFLSGLAGWKYLIIALILNGMFIYLALSLLFAHANKQHRLAIQTFNYSLIYLLLLFLALLADHGNYL